jgi:hypothetical protein
MKEKIFLLDPYENPGVVRILRAILGVACIAIAVFWIIISFTSKKTEWTSWAASGFLILFGIYQIMAGLRKTAKYFKTGPDRIRFKQHSVFPSVEVIPDEISKIELFPLSIKFHRKSRGRIIFRFGLSYAGIIDPVKQEIIAFAEHNKILLEVVEEEL